MAKAKHIKAHDSIVRNVFGRRRTFAVLVHRLLPPDLLAYVDFRSLRSGPTVRTNDELGTRSSDLCFTVDLVHRRRRYPLHLPLEHQSNLARWMPWRAHVYVGDLWRGHIKDHPGRPYTLPFVLPILLAQHPARHTPCRLTSILAMPRELRDLLGTPVELSMLVDDLSGSVLDQPNADPATLALVEVTRAFLYAYENPRSLTKRRLTTLATQLDILLARNDPDPDTQATGLDDVYALWKYVTEVFEETSPLRTLLLKAVSQPVREVYMTIEESLLAKGEKKGMAKGRKQGLATGKKQGLATGKKQGLATGKKQGLATGKKQGLATGLATAVLDLLELRALPVPLRGRRRVLATRDEPLLRRWHARALTVASAEGLFEPLEASAMSA
jgi:predicted transposase YdaD